MEKFFTDLLSKDVGAGTVSILLIVCGLALIKGFKNESAVAPYILPILGLTFILPCVIISVLILDPKPSSDVVMGIIGTIVGYIFGSGQAIRHQIDVSATQPNIQNKSGSAPATDESGNLSPSPSASGKQ